MKPEDYLREIEKLQERGRERGRKALVVDLSQLWGINDPLELLTALRTITERFEAAQASMSAKRRAAIVQMRRLGFSWRDIGDLMGLSRAGARAIVIRGVDPDRAPEAAGA